MYTAAAVLRCTLTPTYAHALFDTHTNTHCTGGVGGGLQWSALAPVGRSRLHLLLCSDLMRWHHRQRLLR
jgi:hypothetical protein